MVLGEIGDKFPLALVKATDSARQDLADLRQWKPAWFPMMFEREIAGIVHTRIWANLMAELDDVPGFEFRNKEPHREVKISTSAGRTYTVRVKRHTAKDRVRSYPTSSALHFWGGLTATFEDMEEVSLAAGYRWDAVSGEVGLPVISYREGMENPIWTVEVDAKAAEGAATIDYTQITDPALPTVDLLDSAEEDDETGDAGQ
ncbi:hypothetical protein ACH473_10485 [Cellulosimicrobium funkei]|uniref:hypothetical protein n=1 Tax=Cellulosimicrobium funkei TaxID=264251 RepID=UPI0037BCF13B